MGELPDENENITVIEDLMGQTVMQVLFASHAISL